MSKLHVYQKIILIFLAMMIPFYLINLWMNMTGQSFIKDGISNATLSNVKFYSRQVDDQMVFIRNLQLQFLNDSDLQKLSFLGKRIEEYEEIQLVNRVKERLVTIQNSSDYLLNVGVYIKSFDRTISSRGGIKKLPNSEHDVIAGYSETQPAQPLYYSGGKLFFVASANNASIVAYFELSVGKFEETLRPLVDYYVDSGAVLTDDHFIKTITVKEKAAVDAVLQQIQAGVMGRTPDQVPDSFTVHNEKHPYMITHSRIATLGLTLYMYVNQSEVTGPLKAFNIWYILLSVVSLAIILVFSFSVNWMIHKPLKKLMKSLKILEADNLILSIAPNHDNEFGYLYRNFDQMVVKLKQSIQENFEQKIALQHSELKQLQSQINPHFLYNSFFNIYMICRSGDVDSASELARRLGSYYQFITRSGKDLATLADEYQHAMDYCEIQSIRFSNRIEVEAADMPESCKSYLVPRLILQPVVENAFEHAFENGQRRGHVCVTNAFENSQLRIIVEDNGDTLTDEILNKLQYQLANTEQISEKTGLVNVSRRIRLKFGDANGIYVSRSALGGLKAEIIIHFTENGG
ncbi:two-component system sensor histidine kinase YesM [Paenibacillus baekrokdamisoli]|nr:histidine kinase [Paenibacillus baekrokdamisoli]MBB3067799.1 two-component system sensor histidine kinase YesM [Paenibacillus baekrokdamisoli]